MPTLDYFKTHPLRVPKKQHSLLIGQVRKTEAASTYKSKIHPSAGAYIHYGGVELADRLFILKPTIEPEHLEDMAKHWYASCGAICKQLLFYTWSICSKEMRHGSIGKCEKAFSSWEKYTDPNYQTAMNLCQTVSGGGSYTSHLDNNPEVPVGPYMEAVERQFRKGGWGGAYGGPKWADITLEMVRYFNGDASAMIAADRLWSAVHNTGPIFNKGFYFEYHDSNLLTILNAQATSSVFDLGTPENFLSKKGYEHQTSYNFIVFAEMALAAIKTVQPDYELGSTGGLNADGTKTSGGPASKKTGKKGKTSFGPFSYKPGQRETAQ